MTAKIEKENLKPDQQKNCCCQRCHYGCCQAQFKSSSVPVQLGTETGLIITVRPTHPPTPPTPDKYIASTQEAEIWYAS